MYVYICVCICIYLYVICIEMYVYACNIYIKMIPKLDVSKFVDVFSVNLGGFEI